MAQANPDAFFFPSRLFVAFVIAVLATSTLCAITINGLIAMRASILNADVAASRAVFAGINSMQSLFLSSRSAELFDREINWAYQQVFVWAWFDCRVRRHDDDI